MADISNKIKKIVILLLVFLLMATGFLIYYRKIVPKHLELNSDISELLCKSIDAILALDGAVLLAEEKVNANDTNQEFATAYEIAIISNEEGADQEGTRFQFVQYNSTGEEIKQISWVDQYDNGVAGNPIDGYSFCGIDSNTTRLTVEETVGKMGYELKSQDTLGDSMTIMDFSKDTKTLRVMCIMEGPQENAICNITLVDSPLGANQ